MRPKSKSAKYKVALMEKLIVRMRMKEVAQDHGAKLDVLAVPAHFDVEDYSDVWRVDRKQEPEYRLANLTDTLEAIARISDVPCLNLFHFLRKHRKKHDLYFKGDDHWNDVGQELSVERTATFLAAQGLVESPDPEG